MDYNFYVENERVRIVERKRGSPIDKLVSEMMILVNSEWGARCSPKRACRPSTASQSNGKVRMSTVPAAHQGLGVAQYIWASSPLRRYVDLVNQRQLIAWRARRAAAVCAQAASAADGDARLRAWPTRSTPNSSAPWSATGVCAGWSRKAVTHRSAEVIRENLVKIDRHPADHAGARHCPTWSPGHRSTLEISDIDLLEVTFHAEFVGRRALRALRNDSGPLLDMH